MNMYNINNEQIVQKLRLLKVCAKDDFQNNCFNFLILDDCLNIAFLYDDSSSLEILKVNIKIYITNIINFCDITFEKDFKSSEKDLKSFSKDLSKLSEVDKVLYKYKLKQILNFERIYFINYLQLLK